MKLQFSLPYRAEWGQTLCVELTLLSGRGREKPVLVPMDTQDGLLWRAEYRVMETGIQQFRYAYAVYAGDEMLRREWTRVPRLFDADAGRDFKMDDFWMDVPSRPWLFDPQFNAAAAPAADAAALHTPVFNQTIVFRVLAPWLEQGQAIALLGTQPPLGDWRQERALRLADTGCGEWRLAISMTALQLPVQYKYVVVDTQTGDIVEWEYGNNRRIEAGSSRIEATTSHALTTICRNDGMFRIENPDDGSSLADMIEAAHERGLTAVDLQTLDEMLQLCPPTADVMAADTEEADESRE